MSWLLIAVLTAFIASPLAPVVHGATKKYASYILATVPGALFLYFLTFLGSVSAGEVTRTSLPWLGSLGVNLSLYVDGLSLLFSLLITGIGTLIIIYAGSYLKGRKHLGRLYAFLLLFMGSMLGVVLSDNMIALFVFWELTSLSSYLLIGFNHRSLDSRKAALQALLVTGAGGLVLLFGLIMLGQLSGTYELSELREYTGPLTTTLVVLILAGAFTKSAQFPFHFWLPNAMEAPTPVSAYLHSATMVKAGIYLIARFTPVFEGMYSWHMLVTVAGLLTMLIGAYLSLKQSDLKKILAYTTVSSLGIIVFLLGLGTPEAITAACIYLVAHALYKGALFMVAGTIDHETGTREVTALAGLKKVMPFTGIAALLAGLSMAGLPPFAGFVGKEILYQAVFDFPVSPYILVTLCIAANAALTAAVLVVVAGPFWGPVVRAPKTPHEAPAPLWAGAALLGLLGLASAVLLVPLARYIIGPMASSIAGIDVPVKLVLWHGFGAPLLFSIITILLGVAIFLVSKPIRESKLFSLLDDLGPERWYAWSLAGLINFSRLQTRLIQSGYLRHYLLVIILSTILLIGYLLAVDIYSGVNPMAGIFSRIQAAYIHEIILSFIVIAGVLTVINSKSRLGAVAALGVVGYGMALIFILFAAPDLAMTQFSIETLSVILFIFVLYKLPSFSNFSTRFVRARDLTVATAFGALMASLVLIVTKEPLEPMLAPFFAENSYVLAHGRNVVNVILVDFRALDTLGEIVVIAVAAIGVHALLRLRITKEEN